MKLSKIMIVDDDEDICTVAELAARRIGNWEVVVATSGEEALAKARSDRPDVILLDAMMPVLDGPATMAKLREDPATATIPVIFLTAKKADADKKYGERIGGDVYLTKPYNQNELLHVVDKLLRERARPDVEREPLDPLKRDADWQD